jgi:hypothetical protein
MILESTTRKSVIESWSISGSILETAQHELSEEVRLRGGSYVRLIKDESDGIGEVRFIFVLFTFTLIGQVV